MASNDSRHHEKLIEENPPPEIHAIQPDESFEWFVQQLQAKRDDTALELLALCHLGIQLYWFSSQLYMLNRQVNTLLDTEGQHDEANGDSKP